MESLPSGGKYSSLGNWDICKEPKILLTNETKWHKSWTRLKGWVQKIFQILLPNFGKVRNESCLNFHPFLHGMGESVQTAG
jgi:hypothetical protein